MTMSAMVLDRRAPAADEGIAALYRTAEAVGVYRRLGFSVVCGATHFRRP